jgi:hypothetical protein
MKKLTLIILTAILISCTKNKTENYNVQDFIEVDINGNYNSYYQHLSSIYKIHLKRKYHTENSKKVIDSIRVNHLPSRKAILNGDIQLGYKITDTFNIDNIIIYKFRMYVNSSIEEGELFQESMVLELTEENHTRYLHYTPNKFPQVDSLIQESFDKQILEKINTVSKIQTIDIKNENVSEINKAFKNFVSLLENENMNFIKYIYPAIYDEILIENNQTELSSKQKIEFLKILKEDKANQELKFNAYYIESISKIECSEKDSYILIYAIEVGNNIYIPGKAIVIKENDNIYFIENDYISANFPAMFSPTYMNCLKNITE